jgi:cytochrome c
VRFLAVLLLSALPAAAAPAGDAAGNPERGAAVYERCQACHSLERNRSGPKHCGLLGRTAGAVPGFLGYSAALKDSGIVWTAESLERFLADPRGTVPGTRMGYAGVKDPQERADLIAFLAAAGPCED